MEHRDDIIIVKARVQLRTTAEGGRVGGIVSGYRPNHVFEHFDDVRKMRTYIGDINFNDSELMQPGETKVVTVRFLRNHIVESYIQVGRKWLIYEVPKLIGEGEIIEILAG